MPDREHFDFFRLMCVCTILCMISWGFGMSALGWSFMAVAYTLSTAHVIDGVTQLLWRPQ